MTDKKRMLGPPYGGGVGSRRAGKSSADLGNTVLFDSLASSHQE